MVYAIARGSRFTGYYRDKGGARKSAGTFDTEAEALVRAEVAQEQGELGEYRLSMTLAEYVRAWLANADLMPITKKNYQSVLSTHVLPVLGTKKIGDIGRVQVRMLLQRLATSGVSGAVRTHVKSALGSAFKELLEYDLIEVNPTHKVTVKTVRKAVGLNVMSPEEFHGVLPNLPNDSARLLAKMLVVSGCRFGEATELRVSDLDATTNEVHIRRRVSDLGAEINEGERFRVIEGTKSGRTRVVTIGKSLMDGLMSYAVQHGVQQEELLFPRRRVVQKPVEVLLPPKEMEHEHGTRTGYTKGGCRCTDCRTANMLYQQNWRLLKGQLTGSASTNGGDHLPRDVWRTIWRTAVRQSGMTWIPRTHDLRHTNATQLLKNGVDLHEVKERLGHQSISTTEGYLHRVRQQVSKAHEAVADFL